MIDWPFAHQSELAKKAEMFETPEWCVEAILDREILTNQVIDPCVGRGVMARAASKRGHKVHAIDLFDWGFEPDYKERIAYARNVNFFNVRPREVIGDVDWTCFMNPPFSLAMQFVGHAMDENARKIVMFQRWAFFESKRRREFWERHPPQRVYVCAERATCWRLDIPPAERKTRGQSTTAHAWFVWERGHPGGPTIGRLEK